MAFTQLRCELPASAGDVATAHATRTTKAPCFMACYNAYNSAVVSPTASTTERAATLAVIVAALGYFVDIYDLILFGMVRVESLKSLGVTDPTAIKEQGIYLINMQM